MTKKYTLKGLDCAACAAKIEAEAASINGVSGAALNFMSGVLSVDYEPKQIEDIDREIANAVHSHEPDVEIDFPAETNHGDNEEEDAKKSLIYLCIGAFVYAAAFVITALFEVPRLLELALFVAAYLILGGNVLLRAGKNILRGKIFDENFLMSIATLGAFALGEFAEAGAVMLFYQIGEYFQDAAVRRSRRSISELMDIRPDSANIIRNGNAQAVPPEMVEVGDYILIKPGEKIPLDGVIVEGSSAIDTSSLTGESIPRSVSAGDSVLSGCINQSGVLTVEVKKPFGESTAVKIIELVENAGSKKAKTENFITKFAKYYTPAVVGIALLLAVIPPLLFGGQWMQWVNRGLIFLVISCPCALVISIPMGFFGGIGTASRHGILIKGGNYIEALASLDTVVFDKTGTLTTGEFEVSEILPASGFSREDTLAFAASAEAFSGHPIARSVIIAAGEPDRTGLSEYHELAGRGVSVKKNGQLILAGNAALMKEHDIEFEQVSSSTVIYVAVNDRFAGSILISDKIKPDSASAVLELKNLGVRKTVMLTGDEEQTAAAVADALGIDEVYARLLPAQKVEILEQLSEKASPSGKMAFVGDGINDAPVLARADVGVAMGALGSDAAIEAADVVLVNDEPSKLAEAVRISKHTKRIIWQNIIFTLGVKAVFLLLGAFGIATMWEAVFADVGVSLLAVLNSMRVRRIKG